MGYSLWGCWRCWPALLWALCSTAVSESGRPHRSTKCCSDALKTGGSSVGAVRWSDIHTTDSNLGLLDWKVAHYCFHAMKLWHDWDFWRDRSHYRAHWSQDTLLTRPAQRENIGINFMHLAPQLLKLVYAPASSCTSGFATLKSQMFWPLSGATYINAVLHMET